MRSVCGGLICDDIVPRRMLVDVVNVITTTRLKTSMSNACRTRNYEISERNFKVIRSSL